MAYAGMPLLQELARAADSNDIKDQLSVLLKREVNEASEKMHDYYRLSDELREEGGLDSVVVAMTKLSSFVGCGSEERRCMVNVIVSATVSMTSVGGVPVEEYVPELVDSFTIGAKVGANCVSTALPLLADWLSGEAEVVANLSHALYGSCC
uniref:Uncharacterized protein n=1 Tax=Tanacetum cinerariifolium TaxID=118510 RepID=A0A6L2P5L5_TANCI|nr:hypothetical protein [Tanacetum cinerariifolium]